MARNTILIKDTEMPKKPIQPVRELFQREDSCFNSKQSKRAKVNKQRLSTRFSFGPGFWNIQFHSFLNLEFKKCSKLIAYAVDLLMLTKGKTQEEVENYANIEISKITKWARENKMTFNEQKSKMMIITRRRPKNKREYKYTVTTLMRQEETIKYLGIIRDKRFNFNTHIDYTTGKCVKLIHALSKSAKVNLGLRHDVLRLVYSGAILPILSYGAQVWIETLQRKCNVRKVRRIQRLTNIKITKAYRTTLHEALCVLTGSTPVIIELENTAKLYHITHGKNQDGLDDAPKNYRRWPHPAEAIDLKYKRDDMEYRIEIYTDGSKNE